jgi:anti-sigma B factor antagonist
MASAVTAAPWLPPEPMALANSENILDASLGTAAELKPAAGTNDMTTTSSVQDGILFVRLSGDLIGSPDTQLLLQSVNDHLGEAVTNCAVDLSEIRYINSTGIGVLVSLLTKFRSRGGEMVLINPADHPKKMLALTKLNAIFAVAPDEQAARLQLVPAAQ